MDLSPDGKTLRVQSESSVMFNAEKSGKKTNTTLIISSEDRSLLFQQSPKKIVVGYSNELFLRDISDISTIGSLSEKLIVTISWIQNQHHHVTSHEKSDGDHSQTIDSEECRILITQKLKDELDEYRAYLTYEQYIRELLTYYTQPPHTVSREI